MPFSKNTVKHEKTAFSLQNRSLVVLLATRGAALAPTLQVSWSSKRQSRVTGSHLEASLPPARRSGEAGEPHAGGELPLGDSDRWVSAAERTWRAGRAAGPGCEGRRGPGGRNERRRRGESGGSGPGGSGPVPRQLRRAQRPAEPSLQVPGRAAGAGAGSRPGAAGRAGRCGQGGAGSGRRAVGAALAEAAVCGRVSVLPIEWHTLGNVGR